MTQQLYWVDVPEKRQHVHKEAGLLVIRTTWKSPRAHQERPDSEMVTRWNMMEVNRVSQGYLHQHG